MVFGTINGMTPTARADDLYAKNLSFATGIDVAEKGLVPGAQIVQARFSLRGHGKPVLGTFPLAGEPDLAFPAGAGQEVQLVLAEGALLF